MPSDAPAWSLHSRLKEDTIDIGDLPLCRVLVIKDANYPWLLLVPRRHEAVEIIDLDEVEQAQLIAEISRVARALKEIRPRPVWGAVPPLAQDAEEVQNFISALRRKIWLG